MRATSARSQTKHPADVVNCATNSGSNDALRGAGQSHREEQRYGNFLEASDRMEAFRFRCT
jgi:hypothetical protein